MSCETRPRSKEGILGARLREALPRRPLATERERTARAKSGPKSPKRKAERTTQNTEQGAREGTGDAPAFEFVDAVTSDLTFVARAKSLDALFLAAAEAFVAATVAAPQTIEPRVRCSVSLEDHELELLLLRFLNELVYLRDADLLLLRPRRVKVTRGDRCQLEAELAGEAIDRDRHELLAEVKAATAHGLQIVHRTGGWEATVTLDV